MRMTNRSRYKGFFSVDALISILPLAMIALILAQTASELSWKAQGAFSSQQAFDKLVSAADHSVKSGAAVHGEGVRYPNWISPGALTEEYAEALRAQAGLRRLYIGMSETDEEYRFCIYRLVVYGEEKRMGKLFVCGD